VAYQRLKAEFLSEALEQDTKLKLSMSALQRAIVRRA
jgi:hypothetical protein